MVSAAERWGRRCPRWGSNPQRHSSRGARVSVVVSLSAALRVLLLVPRHQLRHVFGATMLGRISDGDHEGSRRASGVPDSQSFRRCANADAVAVGVDDLKVATPIIVLDDGVATYRGRGVDIRDPEIDERARPGVAGVLGQVNDCVVSPDADVQREARLKAVLELHFELEVPLVPLRSSGGICNSKDRREVDGHPSSMPVEATLALALLARDRSRGLRRKDVAPSTQVAEWAAATASRCCCRSTPSALPARRTRPAGASPLPSG